MVPHVLDNAANTPVPFSRKQEGIAILPQQLLFQQRLYKRIELAIEINTPGEIEGEFIQERQIAGLEDPVQRLDQIVLRARMRSS